MSDSPAAKSGINETAAAERQSLRSFLAELERERQLLRITEPVDPVFEISSYLAELAYGQAALFESVRGHRLRAVGNVLNSMERIARGLAVERASLQAKIVRAVRSPLARRLVEGAPCQEVMVVDPDLETELPVPHFFPGESGRYITAGAIVAKDTKTGGRNLSFARLKLRGGSRALIGIAPSHHLAVMARAAKARGEKLDIAVTIGNHPCVLIAAALYLNLGDDELEVAGAIFGEPIEVVACRSVELEVPAQCEIVLEGTLDPDEEEAEGKVSEFHGMYEDYGSGAIVHFHRLTRRADALYQVIQPGYYPEHTLIGGVSIAAALFRRLADAAVPVREVAVGHGGCGRLHAVVSLAQSSAGEPKKAMLTAFNSVNLVKMVTVVDADIDPWDRNDVEWAISTRMKAERDLVVVPGSRADRSEPLSGSGMTAKLGIDATRKAGDRRDWTRALPPEDIARRVRARLADRKDSR